MQRIGGLLVACRDGPPLLYPGPEALDDVAVVVGPSGTGDQRIGLLVWDRRARAKVPNPWTENIRGVAAVACRPPGLSGGTARRSGASGSSWAWPGTRTKPSARPPPSAITQAFVSSPPRERQSASRSSRCAPDPLFSTPPRPSRALPHVQPCPAVEGLRRHPPWPQLRRDAPLLRSVPMPPRNRFDGAAKVMVLRFAVRPAFLDQRIQSFPFLVRQNLNSMLNCHHRKVGANL